MKMNEKKDLNILYGLTGDNNPDTVKAISITLATIIKHCGYDIATHVKVYHKGDNVFVYYPNGKIFKFYLPQRKLYHYNGNGRYNLINWTKAKEIMAENNDITDDILEHSRPPPCNSFTLID